MLYQQLKKTVKFSSWAERLLLKVFFLRTTPHPERAILEAARELLLESAQISAVHISTSPLHVWGHRAAGVRWSLSDSASMRRARISASALTVPTCSATLLTLASPAAPPIKRALAAGHEGIAGDAWGERAGRPSTVERWCMRMRLCASASWAAAHGRDMKSVGARRHDLACLPPSRPCSRAFVRSTLTLTAVHLLPHPAAPAPPPRLCLPCAATKCTALSLLTLELTTDARTQRHRSPPTRETERP